ncbi:Fibrinogen-like protein 1,Tenascin,Angiopoietin-1,Ryncolin-4,Fibrinogen C domain-containing protein 1,Fibrinogen C domain-containing protein 1-A,Angiopoietin-related protein 2,Techylectin-5A,Fibrinogen alpha chain,Fibroleukin,Angiopoietin-related protein 7,Angiopoietin-related protein 1,Ficolin-2,Tenascin-R,Ficolin-1,Fibrinogen C domain-containing protein 1-B,Angiopoietin-4,Fibrinogen gamma chain [Mytilus coruscus]|uniref:Fibrinogen C-terminal domain-containing protein n=1 Tax=Mytilus coruscus TaxID=42192 RepID=A0A6J8AVF9_MYTCO|nr:Fibrinogen-like protein 1,Tenascin,Angiopoietin-1,Ryncolin-4,Fibrinogen C domain-containing protein 1,Fibrinogen C domain-containing protein 1-A,Angiopoietin-related protein 2,Techylectin-5A,Fibrinogen alpha chain,Fibroleukin,Angiopoietin-related protein 7,Angiopoietin-related protein 1,Ficolin-2,Tenascin-R,Ficolin-1,Fibrinogen C domain-containing protein 1-B,Angiopoietin-4,Fibrinogen gamma chain [Mytilus coruscus]
MFPSLLLYTWTTIIVCAFGYNLTIKTEKFAVEVNKTVSPNLTATEEMSVYSGIVCASWCEGSPPCCAASYNKASKQCQLYSCCEPETVPFENGIVLRKLPDQDKIIDCTDISNGSSSGVYTMYHKDGPFDVYCDVNAEGRWTIIQRRLNGAVDFYRNWQDYKLGFGNVNAEYWLGNDNLHKILSARDYKLRIDLEDWNGETRYVEYDTFFVGNEATNYVLTIGNYSGNVEDSIVFSGKENCDINGMAFSTWDVDNDNGLTDCAKDKKHAGWWYNSCTRSNLNGIYYNGGVEMKDGIYWKNWYSSDYSLKIVAMKIKSKYRRCSKSNW